ncbi:hypothetical protein C8J57DRAFT_1651502 [Mycena rebaudengoi]|nr:hypothetical protein C8J57DRAFT_1651502 [Mycena rebaudengoi]
MASTRPPMDSPILPAFPPELEREIFEIAAIEIPQSMPPTHPCRTTRLIEPLLYRTLIVTFNTKLDPDALCLAIEQHPAKFAKYLWNFLEWENQWDKAWVSLCSGIHNLTWFYADSAMVPALEAMQLRRLSVVLFDLVDRSSVDPDRPLFRTLTHLDMWDSDAEFLTELPFAQFPALTHLSINNLHAENSPFIASTLRDCTRLYVLVNMQTNPFEPGNETHYSVDDPRFVLMWLSNDEYVEDWKVGVEGGKDFWSARNYSLLNGNGGRSTQPHGTGLQIESSRSESSWNTCSEIGDSLSELFEFNPTLLDAFNYDGGGIWKGFIDENTRYSLSGAFGTTLVYYTFPTPGPSQPHIKISIPTPLGWHLSNFKVPLLIPIPILVVEHNGLWCTARTAHLTSLFETDSGSFGIVFTASSVVHHPLQETSLYGWYLFIGDSDGKL